MCVYTRDILDAEDVLKVLKRLAEIDAIRKGKKQYKPDMATRFGLREMTMYASGPPYDDLEFHAEALDELDAFPTYHEVGADMTGVPEDDGDFEEARKKISDALLRVRG